MPESFTNNAPARPGTETQSLGASLAATRPDLLANISPAQHRVLELLLDGLTEPQIAERLGRSRHTVHDHTKAIYSSLNVKNRVQLVLLFSVPGHQTKPAAQPQGQGQARNGAWLNAG